MFIMAGCLVSRPSKPSDDEPNDPIDEYEVLFFEDFNSGVLNEAVWSANTDLVSFEDDGKGGKRAHLRAESTDNSVVIAFLTLWQQFEADYILEFDYILPEGETGFYANLILHSNGEGKWYYWIDMSTNNMVGVFTHDPDADNEWDCRWVAPDLVMTTGVVYKFRIENEPKRVRITITDEDGNVWDSDWIKHVEGGVCCIM